MARELPEASLLESLRLNSLVVVPNALQGLFRRRPAAVAAATKANVDRWAVGLLEGLRDSHGPGPVWVRVLKDRALLVLSRDDARRVLGGSPHPFAPDPEAKRKGMSHFQPDALTLSRGELWENRRRFTEAVLETGKPLHRLAERFLLAAREETDTMLEQVGRGSLEWEAFYRAFRRIARRIVLGDAARDDEEVSDLLTGLMNEANKLPSKPSERFEPFMARIRDYVAAAEEGSLVSLFGEAPSNADTRVEGQLPHWLFATHETLSANAFRALALVASHPAQGAKVDEELVGADLRNPEGIAGLAYLEACLEEAMRLWPTTPLLSRETLEETSWDGAVVPAGTQVLISNTFNHRDRATYEFADRFAPEAWTEGDAGQDWSFNHFSHGPQGCPGAGLALFVGKVVLATLLTERRVRLLDPELSPDRRLPHMLDFFRLRFAVEAKP
jgi:cytochrome P450